MEVDSMDRRVFRLAPSSPAHQYIWIRPINGRKPELLSVDKEWAFRTGDGTAEILIILKEIQVVRSYPTGFKKPPIEHDGPKNQQGRRDHESQESHFG